MLGIVKESEYGFCREHDEPLQIKELYLRARKISDGELLNLGPSHSLHFLNGTWLESQL